MATWPSGTKASTSNLDAGTDSPASARADLKTNVDNVNSVIDMFNITSPANNQILKYNSGTAVFDLASLPTSADTLTTARTIALTGDVAYTSSSFDGSANVTGTATLANTAVSAGSYTYASVTVDSKGRLTAASSGTAPLTSGGALGTPSSGTVTNLTGTASININGTVGATTPAAVTSTTLTVNAANDLRLADTDSSNYVGFKAPATVTTNKIWTLPSADGTAGQMLSTDGSATLSWATAGGGGGADAVGSIQYFTNRGTSQSGVANGSYTNFDQIFENSDLLVTRVNDATFTFKNTGTYYVDMSIFHGYASGSGVSCVLRNLSTPANEPYSAGEFGSFPTSDVSAPYGSLALSRHIFMRILTVTSTSHQYGFRIANTSGTTRDYNINGLIFKIQRLS